MNVSDVISLLALLIAAIELGLFIGRMNSRPRVSEDGHFSR